MNGRRSLQTVGPAKICRSRQDQGTATANSTVVCYTVAAASARACVFCFTLLSLQLARIAAATTHDGVPCLPLPALLRFFATAFSGCKIMACCEQLFLPRCHHSCCCSLCAAICAFIMQLAFEVAVGVAAVMSAGCEGHTTRI